MPPATVVGPVYRFIPASVSDPTPLLVRPTEPTPSWITPENVELPEAFAVRMASVLAEELDTIPADPLRELTDRLLPFRLSVPAFKTSPPAKLLLLPIDSVPSPSFVTPTVLLVVPVNVDAPEKVVVSIAPAEVEVIAPPPARLSIPTATLLPLRSSVPALVMVSGARELLPKAVA